MRRPDPPEGAATEDAKACFCALAIPVEDEIRDLFEKAMAASTMAELYEAWAEIDRRRSGTWSDLAATGLRGQ